MPSAGPFSSLPPPEPVEVTVLFPCLNEEAAIAGCVTAARNSLQDAGIRGEVLVVDNGSTDRSASLAEAAGARVVGESRRGYGSAYLRGMGEARGEHIILLDADGTYPSEMIGDFHRLLQDGAELVMGNRFAGRMEEGAMPFLNRYLGNPVLSGMTRLLFRVGLKDIHCGMRGIRKTSLPPLALQTPGMEFATEMIVKALDQDLRVVEVGIPYRPRIGESKLMPLRDAWRHVEYMLVFSPALLFLWPGAALLLAGLGIQILLLAGPRMVFFHTWDVHTSLAGVAACLTGSTLLGLGTVCTAYAWSIGMRFRHSPLARLLGRTGDRPLRVLGLSLLLTGGGMWAAVALQWFLTGFGALAAVAYLALATSLLAAGLGLLGAAFLIHIIRLR